MKFFRLPIVGKGVVVVFDMCSSSDVLEELVLRGDLRRFDQFLTSLKQYLAEAQHRIPFDPYKFTGDGWILLFPKKTDGQALLTFLKDLCTFFRKEFKQEVLRHLGTPPRITGLTFGLEMGPLTPTTMYQQQEYFGRAINVACRLQAAIKDKDGFPAYKALVSNAVFNEYLAPATGFKVTLAKRSLRNIRSGADYECRKIVLLDSTGPVRSTLVQSKRGASGPR